VSGERPAGIRRTLETRSPPPAAPGPWLTALRRASEHVNHPALTKRAGSGGLTSHHREDENMSAARQANEVNVKAHDAFFIDGKWQKPAGTGVLNVISPVTEEVVMTFPEASPKDVDKAVAAAREAFDNGPWPQLAAEERGNYLLKVAENLKA